MKTKELSKESKNNRVFACSQFLKAPFKGVSKVLLICLLVNSFTCLQAQVTVGGVTDAAAGALLDLNSVNGAKGGLLLSNVALTDLTKIPGNYAFAGIATEQDDNTELTGAMVYNTNATTGVGVYLWNGTNWTPMGEDCRGLAENNVHIAAYPFVKVSTPVSFSVSTDATGRCAEGETYTWSVSGGSAAISAPTASATSITFNSVGTYTVQVEVKNRYSAPVAKTMAVEVNNDGSLPTNALASGYGIVGKTCLDVKQSKQPVSQSDPAFAAREDAFPDAGSYAKTYEFVHGGGYSDLSLSYLDDPVTGIVESITSPPASVAVSGSQAFTVRFKSGVKNLVPSNGDSLTVKLIASYKTAAAPLVTKYAYLEIRVEDGTCVCPAKKSATEWLNFMCHNLGGEDIISSSQLITRAHHGDWYRFGAKTASLENDGTYDANVNGLDWSITARPYQDDLLDWSAANNPCPAGWRLPTPTEWMAVMGITVDNSATIDANSTTNSGNAISSVPSGSWPANEFTNFKNVGGSLILPAAGYRHHSDGALSYRGSCGYYWSSAAESSNAAWFNAWFLDVSYGYQSMRSSSKAHGWSVRCVAAEF